MKEYQRRGLQERKKRRSAGLRRFQKKEKRLKGRKLEPSLKLE